MSAILTLVFSILSGIPGQLGRYFEKKQELESIRLETQRQIAIAQQQMASDMAKAEADTAIYRLKATGQYFKYFTFMMWFGPFISGVFFPSFAEDIFKNLGLMPVWYVQSCVMIMFAVWGIQVAAPVVAGIFSNLNNFLGDRRQYKLEKAKIDRKAFYDALRKLKGVVSPEDVKQLNAALDEADKE